MTDTTWCVSTPTGLQANTVARSKSEAIDYYMSAARLLEGIAEPWDKLRQTRDLEVVRVALHPLTPETADAAGMLE